jgi:hypothetical protein
MIQRLTQENTHTPVIGDCSRSGQIYGRRTLSLILTKAIRGTRKSCLKPLDDSINTALRPLSLDL